MTLKLAIVGAGPSGFYLASRLLHLLRANDEVQIHLYDRLWAPHGLVRYGVAPDHPEVKNCTHKFDTTASDSRVRFFGNVNVGVRPSAFPTAPHIATASVDRQRPLHAHALRLPLDALRRHYTHLALATGAPHPKQHPLLRRSAVCIPALDIVHWYTLHPSSPSTTSLLAPIPRGTRHVTLVGHGNVSLDIARILLTPPHQLASLDIPAHVLHALEETWPTLTQVSIVGRRGPSDVRFTAKELREMMHLDAATMWAIPERVIGGVEADVGLGRQQARVVKLLREGSKREGGRGKTFSFEFWRAPVGYEESSRSEGGARAVLRLEKTEARDGRVVGTGEYDSLRTDLMVTSLGYEGDAEMWEGGEGSLPWFDKSTARIRTGLGGRVMAADGNWVPGVYATGWAARGASGVLAGTLIDANNVAASIVEDLSQDGVAARGVAAGLPPVVEAGLREGRVVDYATWRRVEEEERRRGAGVKERERMRWDDVVQYARQDLSSPKPCV